VLQPTLVAVSKTKPPFMLQAAFDIGQRHFGENYVQELCSKHGELPREIQWHFIGHLQSNKCKSIVEIPNLYVVETVDSEKLAKQLQKACLSVGRADTLRVMVQVNTSDEESKYGCEPKDAVAIAKCIAEQCPNLKLAGLMTIGKLAGDPAPCFQVRLDQFSIHSIGLEIQV
jgi:pyridoxal phosphate enzyme (YggS family)